MKELRILIPVTLLLSFVYLFSCSNNNGKIKNNNVEVKVKHIKNKRKNDLSENNLNGKVKTIIDSSFSKYGYNKEWCLDNIYKYDSNGFELENIHYYDGKILDKSMHKYNDCGDLIESYYENGPNYIQTSKYSYKYDQYWDKVECLWEGVNRTIYKNDDKGKCIYSINYSLEGKINDSSIYKYDQKGNLTYSITYNGDGTISDSSVYKYDLNGFKILSINYNSQGIITSQSNSKYDDKGNKIKYYSFWSSGRVQSSHKYTEFDEEGNWIRRITNGDINEKRTIEYY
jgi:hypothetical protein